MNDMNAGMDITKEQINKIIKSDLINNAEFYFVTNYNPENYNWLKDELKNFKNVNFLYLNARPDDFEIPTLEKLKQVCDETEEEFYVSYIHTKGVTFYNKPNNQFVTEWRHLLEYFTIEKWKDCVTALTYTETSGINYTTHPWLHYSGNFWWARSSYIKKLPPIKRRINPLNDQSQFNGHTKGWPFRWDAEAWIGIARPTVTNFYTSNVDHYKVPYPASIYRKED